MTDPTLFYRSVPFGELFLMTGLMFYLYTQYQSFQRRVRDIVIVSISMVALMSLIAIISGTLWHITVPILKLDKEGIEYVSTFGTTKKYAWNNIQTKIISERTYKSVSYYLVIYSNANKKLASINMRGIDMSKQGVINALNRYHYCKEER